MKAKNLFLFSLISIFFISEIFAKPSIQEQRNKLVDECKTYIGTPYQYGGLSKDGIDCSGFVYTTVKDATSIQLPRTAKAIYSFVSIIPDDKLQKGDLVFFKTVSSKISHVGVYIGNNNFIHSASDGPHTGVIVSSLNEKYWKNRYAGAGTFFPVEKDNSCNQIEKKSSEKSEENKIQEQKPAKEKEDKPKEQKQSVRKVNQERKDNIRSLFDEMD